MKKSKYAFLILSIFLLSGCVSLRPMALGPKVRDVDTSKESLVLMTLKTSNELRPTYQPFISNIRMSSIGPNKKRYLFKVGKPFRKVKHKSNEYLLSLSLPPGDYKLGTMMGGSSTFILINGSCYLQLFTNFSVGKDEVVYLGRIEANNRKKVDGNELRAGPAIPFVDQIVTGFGAGTFDIDIYDNYEQDIEKFENKFSFISKTPIKKAVLSWEPLTEENRKVRVSN